MRLYLGAMLLKRDWILAGFSDEGMDSAPKGTESGLALEFSWGGISVGMGVL